jgi:uncharacterized short protein YbdD (DUF466 family)
MYQASSSRRICVWAGVTPHDLLAWFKRAVRVAWRGLREWCGDAAYERYLHSRNTHRGSSRTLTPTEFYVEQLGRRYSRPNRCC